MAPWTDLFNNSQTIVVRDPLILDLDGDGIETVNVKDGAYFDHDGNGFAEQTGWASSDDGLLVMDRNSDGVINDGTELFGDQTILQSGQTATDGFQALAELDSNADGIIDVNDTAFSQLKIWQDIDGDGYNNECRFLISDCRCNIHHPSLITHHGINDLHQAVIRDTKWEESSLA